MSKKFVPSYDIDIVNMALSMGWDHRVFGDLGSHEACVARLQEKKGISFEAACAEYRQFLSEEIENFFVKIFGPRSG